MILMIEMKQSQPPKMNGTKCLVLLLGGLLLLAAWPASGQLQQQPNQSSAVRAAAPLGPEQVATNFPYYMQSPIAPQQQQQQQQPQQSQQQQQQQLQQQPLSQVQQLENEAQQLSQRATIPRLVRPISAPRGLLQIAPLSQPVQQQQPNLANELPPKASAQPTCLYDKRYFSRFDECLSRRPYPTIGLSAFKNEDLLLANSVAAGKKQKGDSAKRGCLFTLSNGVFKNYQAASYSLDSDVQCLDSAGKTFITMDFPNATLYYLWQLRCLNYADQLLDDSTLNGKLSESLALDLEENGKQARLCAGSSQTFGFTSLQMNNIEAQVEMATDIYKNWRITNITLGFLSGAGEGPNGGDSKRSNSEPVSSIKEFTFDSLDGDELNWRYLQMFSNWSRNRLHVNFLEQFKRFLWISLQRCLSETSEKLPVKLFDVFSSHTYN